MSIIAASLLAAFLCAAVLPFLGPLAKRIRAEDPKSDRRGRTYRVPRIGGVGLLIATLPAMVWMDLAPGLTWLLALAAGVCLLNFVDDAVGLSPRVRLAAEILAAGLFLNVVGVPEAVLFPGGGVIEHQGVIAVGCLLWMAGAANALNMTDGADGLAGSQSLLALVALMVAGSFHEAFSGTWHLAPLVAALLVFQVRNHPPARIHLGDAGSRSLGFLIAGVPLAGGGSVLGAEVLGLALVTLLLPTADAIHSACRRIRARRSPFRGDRHHLHHRLLRAGLSSESLLAGYARTSCLVIACMMPVVWWPSWLYLGLPAAGMALALSVRGMQWRARYGRALARRPDPVHVTLGPIVRPSIRTAKPAEVTARRPEPAAVRDPELVS